MKKYEAPKLFVDEFVADTMIASGVSANYKNGNPDNNQNCAGCRFAYGAGDPQVAGDWCNYVVTDQTTQDDLDFFC